MRRLRTLLMFAVLVAAAMFAPHSLAAQAVDVTGKWQFAVTTDNGTGTPTLTFKQQGDSITGHYSSQVLGESDFKGTVKDRKIAWTLNVTVQGTSVVVNYAGTVESNDAMKGTFEIAGQMTGSFTGKRQ